ncbi:uncharacterized protein CG45076 [Drosophila tropicalis]|uniref:uncharacterized protein CG45076 n=1 Tax=Drosophila tropicalis TaxID=46794 RepID=UPI0035ABAE5D
MRVDFLIMWLIIFPIPLSLLVDGYSASGPRNRRCLAFEFGTEIGESGSEEGGDSGCESGGSSTHQQQDRQNERSSTGRMKGNSKQRASGIALKAAQEAKQANEDMVGAVKAASDKIKIEYAEKAAAAAKAAEAVLAGKAQVLEQLEMEVREAEIVVQEETQELCAAEGNTQLAQKAHSQAQEELKLLLAGLKLARENYDTSEQVSSVCQQSLSDKTILLEAAQNRVGVLLRQLSEARSDYNKTKKAAYKALCAAQEAKERIDRTRRQANRSGHLVN